MSGRRGLSTIVLTYLLIAILLAFVAPLALAGKYSYAEFLPVLTHETVEILKKHGMPVAHDREDPWLKVSGIPGSYTLKFHQADEIPKQAVLDIIKLCMESFEQHGRNERFRLVLYRESHKQWRDSLFLGVGGLTTMKPFLELTIGGNE